MRVCILLLTASAALASAQCPPTAPSPPTGWTLQTLGSRTYHLYMPASYTNTSSPIPLVVYAHGFTDACDRFGGSCGEAHCNWFTHAEEKVFAFVSLCGDLGDISFNAGTCCPPANTFEVDDVGFARSVVGNLSLSLCIDSQAVFATGFSNGAMLSQRLACEASDVFVAVASVAGVVELQPGGVTGLQTCNASYAASSRRVSVLDVHGLKDDVVPMNGDALLGFPPVLDVEPSNMRNWAWRNSCSGAPTQTFTNGTFSNLRWAQCGADGSAEVEIVLNSVGVHEWPAPTSAFDTTSYVVDWLLRAAARRRVA